MLLGEDAVSKLQKSKVAIIGLGGVGGYAAEALVRSGIGDFVICDFDTVAESNINRQIIATSKTIGMKKTEAVTERILSINPFAKIETISDAYTGGEKFIDGCDYIIDAIDMISAKIALICDAKSKNIPIISAMGAGNKLCADQFMISDIYKTSVCPLCRVMRRELKNKNVESLKVVYSKEKPLTPLVAEKNPQKRQTPGSVSWVPSVMGLIMAGEAVKDLIS